MNLWQIYFTDFGISLLALLMISPKAIPRAVVIRNKVSKFGIRISRST